MVLKIGINGFGRIGRVTFRALLEKSGAQVVAVNDLTENKTLAHLLRYDSLYDKLPYDVKTTEHSIKFNGLVIRTFCERIPDRIPWGVLGVVVFIESSGVFWRKGEAQRHLKAGAAWVVVTAPMKDPDLTVVLGVNEDEFQPAKHRIISNASCSTNALAPVA